MSGARTRRIHQIQSSSLGEFVAKLRAHETECDRNWMTRHDSQEDRPLWLVTPISHGNRSESALDDSNYAIAEKWLNEASSFSDRCQWPDWTGPDGTVYPGTVYYSGGTSERGDLWPGGRIETLLIRADDAPAIRELKRITDALAGYPVLDEEHYCELEWDRDHPSDHECYSEDEECPCAVRNHAHGAVLGEPDEDGEVWCPLCREYVQPGTIVGNGNTHGEDDGSNPDQDELF